MKTEQTIQQGKALGILTDEASEEWLRNVLEASQQKIIQNTGEKLMRLAEADKHAKYLGWIDVETLKKHITNVTGVE